MKRISLLSALVLGGSFLFAPVAKAEQTLDLDFTGVAQANCLFTNITSGLIVALGADIGTIRSTVDLVDGITMPSVANQSPEPAGFTVECNSNTALFVDTPVADAANPEFTAASTKSVLTNTVDTFQIEAYTSAPASGSARSDQFYPLQSDNIGGIPTGPGTDFTVDMNAQSVDGIPVGIYKYTVLVTAVPQ
ncbi:hypothetical protein VB711_05525 [Cronbergia sp. UHCC 0137]|uniref:hypothetical protein n=1 Tax=Cronbergia sp. UHCC 0137 TaxID=3110239 RepID=UPI002B20BD0A|nr:hypothetical protein [Cronbergia sp. UHCC 0137]MEA5617299.1 hypothetical protein [Cronbergia sp. UHCC 0137]